MADVVISVAVAAWGILGQMAPYLLFGFLAAGLLSVVISPETVERHLGRGRVGPVLKAALFGVPLPLCSCGVIPVAASLRRHGASRGATTAFLISTPQTGVDSIFVTYSLLGWLFALFRPVAAFVSGVVGGLLVTTLDGDETTTSTSSAAPPPRGASIEGGLLEGLRYGFVTLPRDVAGALLVGLLAAAVLTAVVPPDFFAGFLGRGLLPKLVMLGLGIPLYVCSTASVPIAAALMASGVSPGAALVFLMTGPATNAATVTTVWRVMGHRTAALYLLSVAGSALGAGMLLDLLVDAAPAGAVQVCLSHGGSTGSTVAAVLLLLVLASATLRRERGLALTPAAADEGAHVVLVIEGMTCDHCRATVQTALTKVAGVTSAAVDRSAGRAAVGGRDVDPTALVAAVTAAGFSARVKDSDD